MSGAAFILLSDGGGPSLPAAPLAGVIAGSMPDEMKVTLSYKTDILTAYNGAERRQALLSNPRERWELVYKLPEATIQELRAAIFELGAATVGIPDWHRPVPMTAAVSGASVSVDTSFVDELHTAGDQILVMNALDQGYIANVTAVSSGTPGPVVLTVDVGPPPGYTFDGSGYVYIVKSILVDDNRELGHYRVARGVLTVTGTVQVPSTPLVGVGGTITTFDSLPVMDRGQVLDAMATAIEQIDRGIEMMDQGVGKMSQRTGRARANIRRRFALNIDSPATRQWLIGMGQALLGAQGPFLLPTWRDDLSLHTQPAPAATTLIINSDPEYAATWFPSLAHRRLQLEHPDGTVEYAKVTAAVDNGNGTQSLTLASGVTGTAISRVGFLEQCRLDSDDIATQWFPTFGLADLVGLVVQQ